MSTPGGRQPCLWEVQGAHRVNGLPILRLGPPHRVGTGVSLGVESLEVCNDGVWGRAEQGTGNGWRGVPSCLQEIDGTMLLGKLCPVPGCRYQCVQLLQLQRHARESYGGHAWSADQLRALQASVCTPCHTLRSEALPRPCFKCGRKPPPASSLATVARREHNAS
jgi:hypothetical protein